MRLIDVDKITDEEIVSYLGASFASCVDDIRELLNDQPITYDIGCVLKELGDLKMKYFLTLANTGDVEIDCTYQNIANTIDEIIEIVKMGGMNE